MNWISETIGDVRYALRQLRRSPIFTVTAILTLTLAVGATTAIYTAFKAVLLDALPYADAKRLVMLWEKNLDFGYERQQCGLPSVAFWKEHNTVFDGIGYMANYDSSVRNFLIVSGDDARVDRVRGRYASAELFDVLGVKPLLGRTLESNEDTEGAPRSMVLSYELWRQFYDRNPDIIGKTVIVGGPKKRHRWPFTVVGVMPPKTGFPPDAQFWLSYSGLEGQALTSELQKFGPVCWVVARLKRNVSLMQARSETDLLQRRLYDQHPDHHREMGSQVVVTPMLDQMTGRKSSTVLTMLLVGVLFVVLIACLNIAELLMARGGARQKEIAVRMAIGATPTRIVRQLVTESVVLALLGGALGVVLAIFVSRALPNFDVGGTYGTMEFRHNRLATAQIDLPVLAFAAGLSLLAALIFGLAPTIQALRTDMNGSLKSDGRSATGGRPRRRLRQILLIAEVSLAMVLVLSAGLMLRSLRNTLSVDIGMSSEGVLVADIDLPVARRQYAGSKHDVTYQIMEQARSIPGIEAVGAAGEVPVVQSGWTDRILVDGRDGVDEDRLPRVFGRTYTPGVFSALNVELNGERDFRDDETLDNELVIIVNQELADQNFPNEDPVGRTVFIGSPVWGPIRRKMNRKRIIAVAQNVKNRSLDWTVKPEFYIPYRQNDYWDGPEVGPQLMFRTKGNPLDYVDALRDRIEDDDRKGKILVNVTTMKTLVAASGAEERFATILLSLFAGLATFLASIGIYGVFAHGITERRRDIGIRVALGAEPGNILRMFLTEGLLLSLAGVAIGLVLAAFCARSLAPLLYGITPHDKLTYVVVSIFVVLIALVATLLATRGALKVEPIETLRE